MQQRDAISALITRLARLDAAGTWTDALNPAQIAALGYLSRANRFSRSPSHVAEYLGTTRGTMSQTLKALERKGYVREVRSEIDRRAISYTLTDQGAQAAARCGPLDAAIDRLDAAQRGALEDGLAAILSDLIAANGGRPFGICRNCIHHRPRGEAGFCALLSMDLREEETTQICHEQQPA